MPSTALPPERPEGYFPHWKVRTCGVILPEERLPWGQTIIFDAQHMIAMAGGTIIVPLIMGFDPRLALFFSGLGTLILFAVVAGRDPSCMGSGGAFVAVVVAATGFSGHGPNPHLGAALGGIVGAGVVYRIIALVVMELSSRWVEQLIHSVVTGAIVAAVGLNVAPIAVNLIGRTALDVSLGLITVLIVGVVAVAAPGILRSCWSQKFLSTSRRSAR